MTRGLRIAEEHAVARIRPRDAAAAAAAKRKYYQQKKLQSDLIFIPLVWETFGYWHTEVVEFMRSLAQLHCSQLDAVAASSLCPAPALTLSRPCMTRLSHACPQMSGSTTHSHDALHIACRQSSCVETLRSCVCICRST